MLIKKCVVCRSVQDPNKSLNEGTLLSCVDACLLKTGSLSLNIEGLTPLVKSRFAS